MKVSGWGEGLEESFAWSQFASVDQCHVHMYTRGIILCAYICTLYLYGVSRPSGERSEGEELNSNFKSSDGGRELVLDLEYLRDTGSSRSERRIKRQIVLLKLCTKSVLHKFGDFSVILSIRGIYIHTYS